MPTRSSKLGEQAETDAERRQATLVELEAGLAYVRRLRQLCYSEANALLKPTRPVLEAVGRSVTAGTEQRPEGIRCASCGNLFQPARRGDATFCSSPCRQRAHRQRVTAKQQELNDGGP